MALQIIIGTTDVTQYVGAGSVNVKRAADGDIGTASFQLLEPVGLHDYARVDQALTDDAILAEALLPAVVEAFASVQIFDTGTLIFQGRIAQVEKSLGPSHLTVSVSCQNVVADLGRVLIYQYSATNTTAGAIVAWVISQCAGVLVNDASYVVDSTSISSYAITGKSALEVLRDLAAQVKATWYVDLTGRLHWRQRSSPENTGKTYGLIQGDGILAGSLSIDIDGAGIANQVTVLAQKGSTSQGGGTQTPSAGADDGHVLSEVSPTWPPTHGQTLSTQDQQHTVSYNRIEYTSTTTHAGGVGYHRAYLGSTWPPPLHPSASYSQFIKSYGGGLYFVNSGYVVFDLTSIPAGATILAAEMQYALTVVENDAAEPNSLFIEVANAANVYEALLDATANYVTIPASIANGSVTVPTSWVTPNAAMYFRVGWLGMNTPVGNNNAYFSSITLVLNWKSPDVSHRTSRAWIRFPAPAISQGANVVSARLRMHVANKSGSPVFRVRKSDVTFPLSVSSYQQETGQEIATVSSVPAAGNWIEIALPPTAIETANPNAFCLDPNIAGPPAASWQVDFSSADGSQANRPQLVLEWQQVTPAIEATAQDAASIAQYGQRQIMIYDPRLSQAECEAMAAREVALRAWPAQSIRLATVSGAGINPGQLVTVVFEEIGIAGSYVVQDISVSYDAAGYAKYQMTLDRFRPDLIRYLRD